MEKKRFINVVSLGDFCGPAQELERIGYRSFSMPFDWLVTADWGKVVQLIYSHFEGFLDEKNLVQEVDVNPKYYYDKEFKIHFYHDFVAEKSLSEQLPKVKRKYQRRIDRFYQVIAEPTLFIRYSQSLQEIEDIAKNKEQYVELLRGYNPDNEIMLVCNRQDADNKAVVRGGVCAS